jgi:hypothetical protein
MSEGLHPSEQRQARVASLLRRQERECELLGSPLYAYLLRRAAEDVEAGGLVWRLLEEHADDPGRSLLALRFLGAVHRLALEGRAQELARFYPTCGGLLDVEGTWQPFLEAIRRNEDELKESVKRPVQTNEVGRAAALVGGFLEIVRQTRLPLRILELGASAGLNLRWDHYRYEADGAAWGDPESPVRLTGSYENPYPPFGVRANVLERRGCDRYPVDITSEDGPLTLKSFIWADQPQRLRRLEAAIAVARRVPAAVDRADAGEWLPNQMTRKTVGLATVVFHSTAWMYFDDSCRERIIGALERAGELAAERAPLAWLRMEGGAKKGPAEVRLTVWPGGRERLLSLAGWHGVPVKWIDDEASHSGDELTGQ